MTEFSDFAKAQIRKQKEKEARQSEWQYSSPVIHALLFVLGLTFPPLLILLFILIIVQAVYGVGKEFNDP